MKVVLLFDDNDGVTSTTNTIGFETDDIEALEASILDAVERYLNDLNNIEHELSKLYEDDSISSEELDHRVYELQKAPYLIRSGRYVLWAGEFVIYQFNCDNAMIPTFVEPNILTIDEWFSTIVEIDYRLH